MKPTIRDVAKLCNVSISTVSRVMNAPETVIESKRIRVQEAIRSLNYQPNAFARSLISKKSNTLGVVIPDVQNPYYGGVIRGMEDAAKLFGYSLLICNTDRDEKRVLSYIDSYSQKHVDGLLFTSDFVSATYYDAIKKYGGPVILVSTESVEYSLPSIMIDEEQAAFDAVMHLFEYGHRYIGFIGFRLPDPISGQRRYDGFLRALRTAGLAERCSHHIEFANHWFEEAYDATARLFDKHPHLTAVFASSDEFALGVIACLNDRGIKVPDQVSVIGFDNVRISWMSIPRLSTIAQPMYEIGYRSVERLHALIKTGKASDLRELIPHQLIVRDSTALAKK